MSDSSLWSNSSEWSSSEKTAVPKSFIVFEVLWYFAWALCLLHAALKHIFLGKKRKPLRFVRALLQLVFLVAYGVLFEWLNSEVLHAYRYNLFLANIFKVPLCIGVAWAAIVYSAMELSDSTGIAPLLRPGLDAVYALTIDFSMDALAIRIDGGFWNWSRLGAWFGVPIGNFLGWWWVVFAASAVFRLYWAFVWPRFAKKDSIHIVFRMLIDVCASFAALVATVVCFLGLFLAEFYLLKQFPQDPAIYTDSLASVIVFSFHIAASALVSFAAVFAALFKHRIANSKFCGSHPKLCKHILGVKQPAPDVSWICVLTWFGSLFCHVYFLSSFGWAGFGVQYPALIAASIGMAVAATLLHVLPFPIARAANNPTQADFDALVA